MVMSATSLRDVSLMAIVPDRECRIPTFTTSPAIAGEGFVGSVLDDEPAGFSAVEAVSSLLHPPDPN